MEQLFIWSILLYPLLALVTPFPRTFIIKGNANNGRHPPSCSHYSFSSYSIYQWQSHRLYQWRSHDAINEASTGATIAGRNPPSCFFISCFTFSLAPSINKPQFSSDSTILIISSKSSFNINKVSPPPALRGPYLLIFLSNLSNIDEVAFVAKLAKTFLSKGTATSISTFLTKLPFILPNALARNPPDWIF